MRKIVVSLFILLITGIVILSSGCEKTNEQGPSGTETSTPAEKETAADFSEPAPVPEGTPPYEEAQ